MMSSQEGLELKSQLFIAHLEKVMSSLQDGPLSPMRKKSWESFIKLGLPQKNNEMFRQVRLRDLYCRSYILPIASQTRTEIDSSLIYPECQNCCIVFINGEFSEEFSLLTSLPKGISVIPLSKAQRTYSSFLQSRLQRLSQEEEDPFVFLNGALLQEGAFIYIQPKTRCDFPIQILHLITEEKEQQNFSINPRLHIFSGRESQTKFIFNQKIVTSQAESYSWINLFLDVAMEENAHLEWNHFNLAEQASIWNLESFRATLKRDSGFKFVNISNGNRSHRQDYKMILSGENSQVSLYGLWKLNQARQSHVNVLMEHLAPHCESLQHFKGILSDFSRSSFEGKIYIHKEAQKTQAYQRNNNLILSDNAQAHSKPNLEIYADDVKASHGATVGQLNEEELFYLKSRGIPQELANNLLIYGFGKEIIDLISFSSVQNEINTFFYGK